MRLGIVRTTYVYIALNFNVAKSKQAVSCTGGGGIIAVIKR